MAQVPLFFGHGTGDFLIANGADFLKFGTVPESLAMQCTSVYVAMPCPKYYRVNGGLIWAVLCRLQGLFWNFICLYLTNRKLFECLCTAIEHEWNHFIRKNTYWKRMLFLLQYKKHKIHYLFVSSDDCAKLETQCNDKL